MYIACLVISIVCQERVKSWKNERERERVKNDDEKISK